MSVTLNSPSSSFVSVNQSTRDTSSSIVNTPAKSTLSVNQGSKSSASIVIKKATDITLQSLNNINASDLQDGYTLIYDAQSAKFVTQPIESVALLVDGGTY